VSVARYLSTGPPYVWEGVRVNGAHDIEQAIAAADVVVAHLGDDDRAAHLAGRHGKPFVRMVHGWCRDATARLAGCDVAVFNSEAARAEFGNGGRSIVVHPVTRPEDHATTPGDRVTLVNLSPQKGGELFRLLAISHPDVAFLGVRGGWGRQEMHRMPSNVDVIRTTVTMRDDVWSRTRVLLIPSERETWGMVGVEALCSGIPVVAADLPGLRESVGRGAYRFLDPTDLAGWQRAVRELQDPEVWALASLRATGRWMELAAEQVDGLDLFADTVEGLCVSV
jgi:hypothetical protein